MINASRIGNLSRFIRHSDTPNLTRFEVVSASEEPSRLFFYTSRTISAGTELTIQRYPKNSLARFIFYD